LGEVFLERVVEDHRRVDELVVRQADLLVQVREPEVHLGVAQLHLSRQGLQVSSEPRVPLLRFFAVELDAQADRVALLGEEVPVSRLQQQLFLLRDGLGPE
jgi:hypothetical protein